MKILMVAPTPFFADRGCHVRILGEIQGLQELGHEVLVCTYPLGRDIPGVAVLRTWPVPWYSKLSAGPSWHKYYIDLMLLGLVRKTVRQWKPDVVHAHLHEGACVASWAVGRRKIPVILDYQGSLTEEVLAHRFTSEKSIQYRLLDRMERWVDNKASAVITSTGSAVEALTKRFGVPSGRIHVITDGVDTRQFSPDASNNGKPALRRQYGIAEHTPLIIYTGLLNVYQGIDLFIEALGLIKQRGVDFHAVIVGFPDIEQYRAMADRRGLDGRVTLTGRVPFETIPAWLADADIAVSPKLAGSEGNIKLYTYMAAGLPSVVFDTPMNREILGDCGVFVPRQEPAAFAESLSTLLSGRAQWKQMGHAARSRAIERFSWRSIAEKIILVYKKTQEACEQ